MSIEFEIVYKDRETGEIIQRFEHFDDLHHCIIDTAEVANRDNLEFIAAMPCDPVRDIGENL